MQKSAETFSTFTNPALATKIPAIKKNPYIFDIKKRHFADMWTLLAIQKRQKYNSITFTTLKKLS